MIRKIPISRMNLPKNSSFLLFYVIIDDCDDNSFKDNEKIVQEIPIIILGGELFKRLHIFLT